MNVSKLINLSLKQLGVLAAGENADANEVADAVDALRGLLAQWATERLFIYKVQPIVINLTGAGAYTLSETIQSVSDHAKLDDADILMVRDLNNTGEYKPVIYSEQKPYWKFQVLEDATKLELNAHVLPTELESFDEIELPTKYERPLILSLALEIAPMFGVEPTQTMFMNQRQAVELLKRSNSTPFYVQNDLPVGVRHGCY
ncbi:hypothetical protein E5093_09725 [Acinetobacter indicus]|uniref:hypothetical protein n=1 Tax=Acinetobacter indicus TaxID=756892 RepID=UPI00159F528D|nr:hypothetical protein [Acinetobacter indicus]QLB59840.1 hypothetical protein E5093_09725 [Acinetobacter indicus]